MSYAGKFAWGGLALMLCIVIAAELLNGKAVPRDVQPVPLPLAATATATVAADNTTGFTNVILARPLFDPSRTPSAATAVVSSGPALMPRLAGIMITPGDQNAVFMTKSGQAIVARKGTKLNGFIVETITDDAVTMFGPHGLTTLHVAFSGLDKGQVVAPSAAPFDGIAGITGTPGGIWMDNGKADLPNAATWPGPRPIGGSIMPDLAPPSTPLPTTP